MKISDKMKSYLVNKYYEIRQEDRKLFFKNIGNQKDVVEDVVEFIQRKHVQFAILKKNGYKIFMILGSNQFADWFYNFWFRFSTTPYKSTGTNKKIKVHSGFYKSYLMIRNDILIRSKNVDKIIIMGQSLGAAIATFAAIDIQYNNEKDVGCLITGSPRVGNQVFVNSYNKRVPDTYRYVHANDIVPGVPWKWMGFRHISKEIHLGKKRTCGMSICDHMYQTGSYINDLTLDKK